MCGMGWRPIARTTFPAPAKSLTHARVPASTDTAVFYISSRRAGSGCVGVGLEPFDGALVWPG